MFEKTDQKLGVSNFSENFPRNIILGLKDQSKSFTGDITRLNVWSKAMTASQLKIKSSCDGMDDSLPEVGDPDLLDWETTEWEIPDGTKIKEIIAYPCSSNQVDLLDVLMPYAVVDLYDAIDTCTVLGGRWKALVQFHNLKTIETLNTLSDEELRSLWIRSVLQVTFKLLIIFI